MKKLISLFSIIGSLSLLSASYIPELGFGSNKKAIDNTVKKEASNSGEIGTCSFVLEGLENIDMSLIQLTKMKMPIPFQQITEQRIELSKLGQKVCDDTRIPNSAKFIEIFKYYESLNTSIYNKNLIAETLATIGYPKREFFLRP